MNGNNTYFSVSRFFAILTKLNANDTCVEKLICINKFFNISLGKNLSVAYNFIVDY